MLFHYRTLIQVVEGGNWRTRKRSRWHQGFQFKALPGSSESFLTVSLWHHEESKNSKTESVVAHSSDLPTLPSSSPSSSRGHCEGQGSTRGALRLPVCCSFILAGQEVLMVPKVAVWVSESPILSHHAGFHILRGPS